MKHDRSFESSTAHSVVRRLMEIRLAWGLTTHCMAEKIGCSATTVNHMESGRRDPGFKVLVRWAGALGFEISLWPKETQ